MARLLVIDDDASLLDVLALSLEEAHHQVATARDGGDGLKKALAAPPPELIVSDVNMPVVDGFSLCTKLREAGRTVPIILLTSRDNEIDEALGLEMGADDYIAKPFSPRVLLARVSALLRREQLRGHGGKASAPLVRGALQLDPERLEVSYKDSPVPVTVTEFKLLEALVARPGIVFSRDQLLQQMRDDGAIVVPRIIDTYVRRLRRKFEHVDSSFDGIETVIGAGYRWKDSR